ncbi:MAG: LysR family transcriptional regulator [Opitutaceae bacterium]|nr:LysR family transcriptional regulator [Opitutaceae bacterium]
MKTAQATPAPTDRYSTLELRHLRLVRAVAEERGLTGASQRLHLTPSALSHQLRQVEGIVGLPLFRRERKAMRLTTAGEILFELAARALAAIDDVEDRLARLRAGSGGTIRLCAHCYTGYHWLPAVMHAFRASHPEAEVRVVAEATYRSIDALMAREVDLVITASDISDPRLRRRPVLHDEIFLVVAPTHPLARRRSVEPVHLADEHILLYAPTPEESGICVEFLKPAGIWPRRYTSVRLTEGIIEMVKAGLGISFLAEWAAKPELDRGTLVAVRLGRRGFKRTWNAITLRETDASPLLESFVDHLAATLQAGKSTARTKLELAS